MSSNNDVSTNNEPIKHELTGKWRISVTSKDGNDIVPQSNVTDAIIKIEPVSTE